MTVAVIDLDDTVYLEREYVRSGFDAVGEYMDRAYGVVDFAERCWRLFEVGHRGTTFDVVLADLHLGPDVREALVDLYRQHAPRIRVLDDVRPALRRARVHGPVAVLTDGWPESQNAKIDALGLRELVDVVVITDALGGPTLRKPHRAGFDAVAACFPAVPASSFVYFGDNPAKDAVGATAAGWRFVRVRRPGSLHESVPSPGPEAPDLLSAIVDGLGPR
jgi:putative hydrolase of the HAD superfamily